MNIGQSILHASRLGRTSLRMVCLCACAVIGNFGLTGEAADEANPPLPLKRVVMLNSGVGYLEHAGTIDGNRLVELPVNTRNLNDLLKSLVVQDMGGGKVTAANYGSPEPISQTLRSLAIDVTTNPSLAHIFHQLRGQKVEVTIAAEAKPVAGTVVGVERRRQVVGREQQVVDQDVILLRTESGLRTFVIDAIQLTRFSDPRTDREFQQALDLLSEARQQDRKLVKLDFQGKGKRDVSVGYVQESPVWKTTYRLVLDENKPPFLQGWAIVENTTADDWKNVSLTLISGRPISFQMELSQPLFAIRPQVGLELHASVAPRTYFQDMFAREDEFLAGGNGIHGLADGSRKRGINLGTWGYNYGGQGGGGFGGGGFGGGGAGGSGGGGGFFGGGQGGGFGGQGGGFGGQGGGLGQQGGQAGPAAPDEAGRRLGVNLAGTVESSAAAEDIGDSFRYVIKSPVTLKRHESSMLPIVNEAIKGDRVYIYNAAVHAKHPLAGLKLRNSTELHFQQGPITVFDGSEYAGDARIADIPPGSSRLISFAMDLDTEVVVRPVAAKQELIGVSIQSGGLVLKSVESRQNEYTIKNSGQNEKRLLIEQPLDAGWPNLEPKPTEQTRDQYRFAVQAEPGKPSKITVKESRNIEERLFVQTLSVTQAEVYLNSNAASPKVVAALKEVIQRKTTLNKATAARAAIDKIIEKETNEQQRLRENLKASLDEALRKRYLQKFGASEDALEKQRERLATARDEETKLEKELESFVANLSVE